jgi:hypothetical protein
MEDARLQNRKKINLIVEFNKLVGVAGIIKEPDKIGF